jgi:activator of 2-hydroxyglutaryl-CoA dehydratase
MINNSIINSPDKLKGLLYTKIIKKVQEQMNKGAQLVSNEIVQKYIDKQVRKEILRAVLAGDLTLIHQFLSKFTHSLFIREDQINFQTGSEEDR